MSKYIITTDYTADMPEEFYAKTKVQRLALPFEIDGVEYDIKNKNIGVHEFYQSIREGKMATTSQVSQYDALTTFDAILAEGNDILHLCFSSGVSSSFDNFGATIRELKAKYPDKKVIVVDSLGGSGSLGMMVDLALKMQQKGKTIEQVAEWIENNKLKFNHLFIVDSLDHLKRGGRLSKIEATLGTLLGIKPVLSLDTAGKITPYAKVRGKKKAYQAMIDNVLENIERFENDYIVLTHSDNLEEITSIGSKLKEALNIDVVYADLSFLIGSHTGADTVAVFYYGKIRE